MRGKGERWGTGIHYWSPFWDSYWTRCEHFFQAMVSIYIPSFILFYHNFSCIHPLSPLPSFYSHLTTRTSDRRSSPISPSLHFSPILSQLLLGNLSSRSEGFDSQKECSTELRVSALPLFSHSLLRILPATYSDLSLPLSTFCRQR